MMEILIKIVQFFLCFTILVTVHELGHFIAARVFRIRVDKFYVFFNPGFSIFKFRLGDTVYGLGWLPLGGYTKIAGMVDESMDREQLRSEPKPWEFRSKPAWQRLIVMLAGVVMNVLLAVAIYAGMSGKPFFKAIGTGFVVMGRVVASYWEGLMRLFAPETKLSENLGGFLSIGSVFPDSWNWPQFWWITALLSIVLAVMNLLPIPGLDGGHALFTLWEMVTGRKPGDKFLERATWVGLVLVLALMVYANGNDIYRFFIKV